jgi:hypothetical protein
MVLSALARELVVWLCSCGKMSFFSTLKAFDRLRSLFFLVLTCCFLLHKRIVSNTTLVIFHDSVHEQLIFKVLAFVELLHTCGKMFISFLSFLTSFLRLSLSIANSLLMSLLSIATFPLVVASVSISSISGCLVSRFQLFQSIYHED